MSEYQKQQRWMIRGFAFVSFHQHIKRMHPEMQRATHITLDTTSSTPLTSTVDEMTIAYQLMRDSKCIHSHIPIWG